MLMKINRALGKAVLVVYAVVSLPFVLLFAQSEYFRFQTWQELARKSANIVPTEYFFCGDSITASGRNWGLPLGLNPLTTFNEGSDGALIRQVTRQVDKVAPKLPKVISIMAGTNDAMQKDFDLQVATGDLRELFELISKYPRISFLITSVPETRDGENRSRIEALNGIIRQEAANHPNVQYIDLNAAFSRNPDNPGSLYVDNVHLSSDGLAIWAELIRERIENLH